MPINEVPLVIESETDEEKKMLKFKGQKCI
jgi:hypothetical protein